MGLSGAARAKPSAKRPEGRGEGGRSPPRNGHGPWSSEAGGPRRGGTAPPLSGRGSQAGADRAAGSGARTPFETHGPLPTRRRHRSDVALGPRRHRYTVVASGGEPARANGVSPVSRGPSAKVPVRHGTHHTRPLGPAGDTLNRVAEPGGAAVEGGCGLGRDGCGGGHGRSPLVRSDERIRSDCCRHISSSPVLTRHGTAR
jgi:hypothetical protein